ncbi:MAG: energy transducer TonB [Opitutaceae bacterium]|nr:energy transducer TonB [Opitutaceae bacterium]
MRTNSILIAWGGLLMAGAAFAQIPPLQQEWQSLRFQQTVDPLFPVRLSQAGVTEGWAHVAISTDATGKLVEWLVVGYSYPEFAEAAVAAIKQWKFEPARLHGEPVGTAVKLLFHYEGKGVVVSSGNNSDFLEAWNMRLMAGRYAYRPCSLRELDRIPLPIVTVAPQYPKELADQGVKGRVTVEFYIDETGAIRVPAVSGNDNSELTALAVAALRQWKFEPPTRNGVAVLVKASQVFNFGP